MTVALLSLLLPALVGQDASSANSKLKKAVRTSNPDVVTLAVAEIAVAAPAEAVEYFLKALALNEKKYADAVKKRDKVENQLEQVTRAWDDARSEYDRLVELNRLNPSDQNIVNKANKAADRANAAMGEYEKITAQLRLHAMPIQVIATIRELIYGGLRKLNKEPAHGAFVERLLNDKNWQVRATLAQMLGHMEKDVVPLLVRAAKAEKEHTVRIELIRSLIWKQQKTPDVIDVIREALRTDSYWQLQVAGLLAAGLLDAYELIGDIIEMFQTAEGRLVDDFHKTLTLLVGQDKGDKPGAWKGWYDAHKAEILSGEFERKRGEQAAQPLTRTTFFGIPVYSKRIIFVLDRSASMREMSSWVPKARPDRKLPAELQQPKSTSRWDVACWQLKRVLAMLPRGAKFNIIFYSDSFEVYKSSLIAVGNRTRAEAYKFINGIQPEGQTNVFDSIEAAIGFATTRDGRIKEDAVDTIYMLSDGQPNMGKYISPVDILREVTRINARHGISINTIWTGDAVEEGAEGASAFMKLISEANHGRFVDKPPE